MPERLAPAVPGRERLPLVRAEAVVEVGRQPPTLDDRRALRRRPLVVDRVAAPRPREPAVVIGGDELLGQPVSHAAGVDARLLLHGVRLEPVPDRLVEEDAAEAVPDDDRHAPGGSVDGVECCDRLARRGLGELLGALRDALEAGVAAAGLMAGLDAVVAPSHDLHPEPHARPVVARREPG
jgi:hypothetical protein